MSLGLWEYFWSTAAWVGPVVTTSFAGRMLIDVKRDMTFVTIVKL